MICSSITIFYTCSFACFVSVVVGVAELIDICDVCNLHTIMISTIINIFYIAVSRCGTAEFADKFVRWVSLYKQWFLGALCAAQQ